MVASDFIYEAIELFNDVDSLVDEFCFLLVNFYEYEIWTDGSEDSMDNYRMALFDVMTQISSQMLDSEISELVVQNPNDFLIRQIGPIYPHEYSKTISNLREELDPLYGDIQVITLSV